MIIGDDTNNDETEVSLELEEVMQCAKLGLEVIFHCLIAGISTKELPELIKQRGEYLRQEPDTTTQEGEQQ